MTKNYLVWDSQGFVSYKRMSFLLWFPWPDILCQVGCCARYGVSLSMLLTLLNGLESTDLWECIHWSKGCWAVVWDRGDNNAIAYRSTKNISRSFRRKLRNKKFDLTFAVNDPPILKAYSLKDNFFHFSNWISWLITSDEISMLYQGMVHQFTLVHMRKDL